MRNWSLVFALSCSPLGCYEGPPSVEDDSTGGESTNGNATQSVDDATAGSSLGGTTDMSTSDSSQMGTSTDEGALDGPSDSSESTSGEMLDCEGGSLMLPLPGCMPPPLPSTGDIQQDCVDRINQFRWECQCLPPLARWNDAETCSDEQSSLDQNGGGPHANFGLCGENAQNTCPDWGSEQQIISGCLQSMWDEGPGEPFSEHGHYINMSSMNYSKVACGFSMSGGGVWSNQNFSP